MSHTQKLTVLLCPKTDARPSIIELGVPSLEKVTYRQAFSQRLFQGLSREARTRGVGTGPTPATTCSPLLPARMNEMPHE
jgi:hypothetical protein